MAYEATVLWSLLSAFVAIYFIWIWQKNKSKHKRRPIPMREAILEATRKRISDQMETDDKDGCQMGKEVEEKSDLKSFDKHFNDTKQNENKSNNKNYRKKLRDEHNVKLTNEQLSNLELDQETHLPVSRPIKSLEEVYNWIPGFDHFNIAKVPLRSTAKESLNVPRTLVCHDMRGGYTEDRFVQGFNSATCYRISEWQYIDIFVYFSHHIVTIPPPCWTNTCHRHGTKVLGTFITEWDNGQKICSDFLETKGSYERLAKQLVEIACYYNFDGWLVNIENTILPEKINDLITFLGFLTESMHNAKPMSEIIWYDSVTNEGKLEWQNELNSKNSAFFDVCDGIFLNYTWSIHNLSHSSLISGNQRKSDVYVGIDCFGRGCFGGGGWSTCKALQVIREQNLSAAIFAPGWVLETQGEENFTRNQNKFWQLIKSYLHPHMLKGLPLASSFSKGYGNNYFSHGMKLLETPWTNLSCQQLQLTFHNECYQIGSGKGVQVKDMFYCTDDAFEGGGCLKLNGLVETGAQGDRSFIRLFRCECELPSAFFISFTFKINQPQLVEIYLSLLLDGNPNYLILGPPRIDEQSNWNVEVHQVIIGERKLRPSQQDFKSNYEIPLKQEKNYVVMQPVNGETESFLNEICTGGNGRLNGWTTRYYLIAAKELPALHEIRVVCQPRSSDHSLKSQFSLLLGEIRVLGIKDILSRFPVISNIRCRDSVIKETAQGWVLSTTVLWDVILQSTKKDNPIIHYDIFCDVGEMDGHKVHDFGVFLGKAYGESFRVSQLKILDKIRRSLAIQIKQVTECNIKADRKEWGRVILEW